MAVSTIAGYTGGGIKIPCILKEGNLTVTANTYGPDGYTDTGITRASPIAWNDWVTLSSDTGNTYDLTYGMPVVVPAAAGTFTLGKVVSEPKWLAVPTTTQTTWATMLAGKWFRVATVEWFGIAGMAKVVHVGDTSNAVVAGVPATIKADASATAALTGGVVTLGTASAGSGGAGIMPFHYAAATGTVSLLVGFYGGTAVIQA